MPTQKLPTIDTIRKYAEWKDQGGSCSAWYKEQTCVMEYLERDMEVDQTTSYISSQNQDNISLENIKAVATLIVYGDLQKLCKEVITKIGEKGNAEVNNGNIQNMARMFSGDRTQHNEAFAINTEKELEQFKGACDEAQKKLDVIEKLFAKDANYREIADDVGRAEKIAEMFCLKGRNNGLYVLTMIDLYKQDLPQNYQELPSHYVGQHKNIAKTLVASLHLPYLKVECQDNFKSFQSEILDNHPRYFQLFSQSCVQAIIKLQGLQPSGLAYKERRELVHNLYYNDPLVMSCDGLRSGEDKSGEETKALLAQISNVPKEVFPVFPNNEKSMYNIEPFQGLFKIFTQNPEKYWKHYKHKSELSKLLTQVAGLHTSIVELHVLIKNAQAVKDREEGYPSIDFVDGNNAYGDLHSEIREQYTEIEKIVTALNTLAVEGKADFMVKQFKGEKIITIDLQDLKQMLPEEDRNKIENLVNIEAIEQELTKCKEQATNAGVTFQVEEGLRDAAETIVVGGEDNQDNKLTKKNSKDNSGYGTEENSRHGTPTDNNNKGHSSDDILNLVSSTLSSLPTENDNEASDKNQNTEVHTMVEGIMEGLVDKAMNEVKNNVSRETLVPVDNSEEESPDSTEEDRNDTSDTTNPAHIEANVITNNTIPHVMSKEIMEGSTVYIYDDENYDGLSRLFNEDNSEEESPDSTEEDRNDTSDTTNPAHIEANVITNNTIPHVTSKEIMEGSTVYIYDDENYDGLSRLFNENNTTGGSTEPPTADNTENNHDHHVDGTQIEESKLPKSKQVLYVVALFPFVAFAVSATVKAALGVTSFFGKDILSALPNLGINNALINKESIFVFLPVVIVTAALMCVAVYLNKSSVITDPRPESLGGGQTVG